MEDYTHNTSEALAHIEAQMSQFDVKQLHDKYECTRWNFYDSQRFLQSIQRDWYHFDQLFSKDEFDANYIHAYKPGMKELVKEWFLEMLRTNPTTIEEGVTGGTIHYYSDHRAVTVMKVIWCKSTKDEVGNPIPREIEVAHNEYKHTGPYEGECEVLETLRNGGSKTESFTLRNGRSRGWWMKGYEAANGNVCMSLGYRRTYIDPSF